MARTVVKAIAAIVPSNDISSCSILQLQPVPMPGSKGAVRTGCRYTRRVRSSSLSNRISTGL